MPAFSGTFSGAIEVQTTLTLPDQTNHEMSLAQVRGPQRSTDALWNNATITYSAVLDLVDAKAHNVGTSSTSTPTEISRGARLKER